MTRKHWIIIGLAALGTLVTLLAFQGWRLGAFDLLLTRMDWCA